MTVYCAIVKRDGAYGKQGQRWHANCATLQPRGVRRKWFIFGNLPPDAFAWQRCPQCGKGWTA